MILNGEEWGKQSVGYFFQEVHKYNLPSTQYHVLLPDRRLQQVAFPLVPDDAAFLRWHKNNSYHYVKLSCHPSCSHLRPAFLSFLAWLV